MTAPLLIENLSAGYGSIRALWGIDLEVKEGQVLALLGSNGAGKTTTIKTILGLVRLTGGDVKIYGRSIKNLPPDAIVKLGIGVSPEGRHIFPNLTVEENLRVGGYRHSDPGRVRSLKGRALELFPVLKDKLNQRGSDLSGGEQQMLAIGRALMADPKLLLLDEPSLGLSPIVCQTIFETIETLSRSGVSILLVEQNVRQAARVASFVHVLQVGHIIHSSPGGSLLNEQLLRQAFLGTTQESAGPNGLQALGRELG